MRYMLTDVDNVVLDWSALFRKFLEFHYHYLDISEDDHTFGLDFNIGDVLWREFNYSNAFRHLMPFRDAQTYIPKISKLGFQFIGISSCLPDDSKYILKRINNRRELNLERHFPGIFQKCHNIVANRPKKDILSLYPASYYVDDRPINVEYSIECGHKSFLMDHNYNRDSIYQTFHRVMSWKEIYHELVKSLSISTPADCFFLD